MFHPKCSYLPLVEVPVISSRIFTRATCPGHVWRMVPELLLLRPFSDSVSSSFSVVHLTENVFHNAVHQSRPASSLMFKLFRYLRASYALLGHDLPNGKSATLAMIIFYKQFDTPTAIVMQKPNSPAHSLATGFHGSSFPPSLLIPPSPAHTSHHRILPCLPCFVCRGSGP